MRAAHVGAIAACLFALGASLTRQAPAEDVYPNRSVHLISDSSAGSAVDTALRVIADGMGQVWHQQVVVINQPGGGGSVSARNASQAAPDGYTIFAPALSAFLAVPGKAPNLPLMIPRDFTAVGYTADQPLAVAVSPTLHVKTLPELIALAKQKPGQLSYAVTGVGRLTHLTGELLQMRAGMKLQMIPYSNNSSQAVVDVFSGRVQIMIEGYTGLAGAFKSGQLIPLAIGSGKRLPEVPDLPTISEAVPGLIASGWQAVVVPNGTPQPVIAKASEALRAALEMPQVKQRLEARGSYPRPMSAAEVTSFIHDQQVLWKPAIERVAAQMHN